MNATKTVLRLWLCAGLLASAPPAGAQAASADTNAEAAASDESEESNDWAGWIQTLEQEAKELGQLRKTEAALQAEVAEAIARRRPRGEEKERLLAAHLRAQKDLGEAEAQFPDLVEQARQAGVPQGLLQDYEDLAEPPANADDGSDW
jgi:hypothetical protein